MDSANVVIVGAGVAGISAALELKKLGIKNITLYERESQVCTTSRHCNHTGFGVPEFKRLLTGQSYAKKLEALANEADLDIKLNHTLTKIDENKLTFSTPDGEITVEADAILLSLGARETPRPDRLISGIRSPNIITTGTLQRFAYMQNIKPFNKAVIVGSEIVSFSAIMSAKHLGIEVVAMVEEKESIDSYAPLKYATQYILNTPVYTNAKIDKIYGKDKRVEGIAITQNSESKNIECDGVIFSGQFTPESAVLQQSLSDFNYTNYSLNLNQNYQSTQENIFLAGNVVRGALSAYKCYFEGKEVANAIFNYLNSQTEPNIVPITADKNIYWYFPTQIDLNSKIDKLTSFRVKEKIYATLEVKLNGRRVYKRDLTALPYKTVTIPWSDIELKEGDKIEVGFRDNL